MAGRGARGARGRGARGRAAAAGGGAPGGVLVVGGGGREHALAWALRRGDPRRAVVCAPGNAGAAREPGVECLPALDAGDAGAVAALCRERGLGLVVVGPEAPLVAGLADELRALGLPVFGPSAAAARLEGSKAYMKDVCRRYGVPTADFEAFDDEGAARAFLEARCAPGGAWASGRAVVKADGLAAGKGVVLCDSAEEAATAAAEMLRGASFGDAGRTVVVEELLEGEEASYFALLDGSAVVPLGSAQDHKAVGEGDTGPNTGGMGAYSPAPVVTPEVEARILAEIVQPLADGMVAEGAPYQGVLFAGVMVEPDTGAPRLLEVNVRFGDPECQCLLSRLRSDLGAVLAAAAEGGLGALPADALEWSPEAALLVVLAARGYPGAYAKGGVIGGLEAAAAAGAKVFHAGTAEDGEGRVTAAGGRVLGVTALGAGVTEAQEAAYAAVDAIQWEDGFCRRDIGYRAVAREARGE